eukprot:scaffold261_cov336-Pavlova_lutheri.AAC.7
MLAALLQTLVDSIFWMNGIQNGSLQVFPIFKATLEDDDAHLEYGKKAPRSCLIGAKINGSCCGEILSELG